MVDTEGREHMIMTFYVQGRPEGEIAAPTETPYLEATSAWFQEKGSAISEISFDEAVDWSKESAKNLWEKSLRAFKYLSGAPLPPPSLPTIPPSELGENAKTEAAKGWGFTGMFSSLKTSKNRNAPAPGHSGRYFTEGEVHADLVKVRNLFHKYLLQLISSLLENEDGYFVFRYLLVDLPSRSFYISRPLLCLIAYQTRLARLEPRTSVRGTAAWNSGQRTSHAMGVMSYLLSLFKNT